MNKTDNVTEMKIRSRQYKKYILNVISKFNTNGKKTVLVTSDSFFPIFDGVMNVVDNYACKLLDRMNVVVLAPSYKGKITLCSYPVIGVKSGFSKRLNYQVPLPMFDFRHRRYLKKLRIDIIHCHAPFTVARVAMRLHKKRRVPLVTTFHSLFKYDFQTNAGPFTDFMMKYILRCFNASNEVWTMNDRCVEILREYGYHGATYLLPHGVSALPAQHYEEERRTMREKLGVDEEVLFIFVGRLIQAKNVHFLVDVLANLKQRGVKFKMLFVGDGIEHAKLEKQIALLGLDREVKLVGQVLDKEELLGIYSAADMLLFPSYYDTFALVKVEAASRFTPTVLVEDCPAASNVTHNVNGYVLPNNVEKYADAVYQILQDRDSLEQVGKNAFRDLYATWDKIVDKVYERYVELMSTSV